MARSWKDWVFVPVLMVTAVAHAVNLFNYPYYHTDEGTYVAQAWAILRRGDLAHYTYWYDHAPIGWIQIAAWAALNHGFYTFGTPVDSGRVLMLLFHCWSTYLVFQIARTISRSLLTATLAALLFGLSAYGIYYHRRVLLDNLTTPWMLLSILMLVRSPLALTRVWLSAVALAVSILSKELTIFLVPALAAFVFLRSDRSQRLFATVSWLFLVGAIVSTYPLMALLKNELFPSGTLLGGQSEHVSLIGSLQLQAARGRDDGLLSLDSSFWRETATWASHEPVLAMGGTLGAIAGVVLIRRFPLYGLVSLATLSLWLFLARGGIILGFYYVPLLPLLALNVALPAGWFIQWLPNVVTRIISAGRLQHVVGLFARCTSGLLALATIAPLAHGYTSDAIGLERNALGLWTITQSSGQREAVDWIRRYVHPGSAILVDDESWVSLREPIPGHPVFDRAHWYIKLDGDPEIRFGVFKNDARNVDYVLNTQDVFDRTREPDVPLARSVVDGSTPIASFDTGRYPVEVRRVNHLNEWRASQDPMLVRSWIAFKTSYVRGGRVADPATAVTTSELQASAMLRSVYMDDRASFDELWAWARSRLQVRGDGLLISRYGPDASGADEILDRSTTSAADQEAALALLFASRQWHQPQYQQQALDMLAGIWRSDTTVVEGSRVVVAGDWARGSNGAEAVVRLASLAPSSYRIFAVADARHPWGTLVESSYRLLSRAQTHPLDGARPGLVPELMRVDINNGTMRAAPGPSSQADRFGASGSQIALGIARDLVWYGDQRAHDVLRRLSLPREELSSRGWLASAYSLDGQPATQRESLAMYAGTLPSLLFQGNDSLAHVIFADKIVRPTFERADPTAFGIDDLASAWLATAFMHGGLANLWANESTVNWSLVASHVASASTTDRLGQPDASVGAVIAAGGARSAIVGSAPRSSTIGQVAPAPGFTASTTDVVVRAPQPQVAQSSVTLNTELTRTASRSQGQARQVLTPSSMASTVAPKSVANRPDATRVIVPGRQEDSPSSQSTPSAPIARQPVVAPGRTPPTAPSSPQVTGDEYVVRAGDSLSDIAERHGTDAVSLARLNGLADPNFIVVGSSLRLPETTLAQDPTDDHLP